MMKKLFLSVFATASIVLGAQNLVPNGDASQDLKYWSENQVIFVENENSCFQTVSTSAEHSQLIEIDPNSHYTLSIRLKAATAKGANLLVGLRPLDENKKTIKSAEVTVLPDSIMTLAAPCDTKDTIIKVKNASKIKFNKAQITYIGFDAKPDFSDLPNRKLSKGIVKSVTDKKDFWEIELKKPCGFTYPAGTAIRLHRESAAFMYPLGRTVLKDTEWHNFSGKIYGKSTQGASSYYFWAGQKYVQIVLIPGRNGMVCFDDIQLKKITKRK